MATSKEMRVGAFVLAGLIVAGIVVFLIGDEKRLFDAKQTYHTSFSDVQGLKRGAPVRLGGIDIGTVARVFHADNPADNRLYVDMLIVKREAGRIKQDTIAKVSNKGLLGDKMIELAGGSPSAAVVPAEGTLQSEDPTDFTNLFSEVGNMTQRADKILGNLEVTTKALADAQLHEDIQRSVHSVSVILKEVAEGKGYVRRVLSDPDEAARLSHLVTMLDRVAVEAEGTVGEARKTMARVNSGPGFVHEVLYGEKGADAMANFGGAAAEVIAALRGIREGNGLAHTVIYGGDETSAQVSANLGAMTYDLRQIIADLRAGKGTLGALLVDPSLYEDVKGVLGNVQRNDALRALVRYSIKQDEKRPAVRVSDQPAPTAKPAR